MVLHYNNTCAYKSLGMYYVSVKLLDSVPYQLVTGIPKYRNESINNDYHYKIENPWQLFSERDFIFLEYCELSKCCYVWK